MLLGVAQALAIFGGHFSSPKKFSFVTGYFSLRLFVHRNVVAWGAHKDSPFACAPWALARMRFCTGGFEILRERRGTKRRASDKFLLAVFEIASENCCCFFFRETCFKVMPKIKFRRPRWCHREQRRASDKILLVVCEIAFEIICFFFGTRASKWCFGKPAY